MASIHLGACLSGVQRVARLVVAALLLAWAASLVGWR